MSVVAHLRDDAVLLRLAREELHLLERERERFLHVHVDAAADGHQGGDRMVVVGRRDERGVDLVAHLLEHLAVVRALPRAGEVEGTVELLRGRLDGPDARRQRVDERDDLHVLLAAHPADEARHLRAAPNQRHTDLPALRDPLRERRREEAADVERGHARRR